MQLCLFYIFVKENLSMFLLNLLATVSVTGLLNTLQFISFVSMGFNILFESDCAVRETMICSVCSPRKKKKRLVYTSLLNTDNFANSLVTVGF